MHWRGRDTYSATWRSLVAALLVGGLTLGVLVGPLGSADPVQAAEHSVVDAGAPAPSSAATSGASTASLVGFDPGNIISDSVFRDVGSMSEAQITSFVQQRGSSCRNTASTTCLKDYREATYSFAGDRYCSGYQSTGHESAVRMIYKSAQACGINPQVLLVTLEKEQGLLSTARTTTTYKRAMGYGCPDNVGGVCDASYAGFHVQVYYAARQFNVYERATNSAGGPYFTAYAPGEYRSVRYHPNASCGSSRIFIRNQSTANLYYYTPYQPNAAALRAGYGTGDGCSAYGNRNFYNYFTDWFGSTQSAVGPVVSSGGVTYLLSGSRRYTVPASLRAEYVKAFGATVAVAASYLREYSDAGTASAFLRNDASGAVSLLQNGQRHRFGSCAQVAVWGSSCHTETRLAAAEYNYIVAGEPISAFAKSSPSSRLFVVDGLTLEPIYNAENARLMNGGAAPYAAVMPSVGVAAKTIGSMRFAAGRFVQRAGDWRVYLATPERRLIRLPSWGQATDAGFSSSIDTGVSIADLRGYTEVGELQPILRCGTRSYLAAGGELIWLHSSIFSGLDSTQLDDVSCGQLKRGAGTAATQLYVQAAGTSGVYRLADGEARLVPNRAVLEALNGGAWPVITKIAPTAAARLKKGAPVVGATGVVTDGAAVYLVSAGQRYRIAAADLNEFEAAIGPRTRVSGDYLSLFRDGGIATRYLRETGTGSVSLLQGGQKHHFSSCAQVALWGGACHTETTISSADYSRVPTGAALTSFVRRDGGAAVYFVEGTRLRQVHDRAAATALNGGSFPYAATMPPSALAALTAGPRIFAPARFVERSGSTRALLPLGDGRLLHLTAWTIADELGMLRGVTARLDPAQLDGYADAGSVGLFVNCDGRTWFASRGSLHPVDAAAAAGFSVSTLDALTCNGLQRDSAQPVGAVFVQPIGRSGVYLAEAGQFRLVSSRAALERLGGGSRPVVLPIATATADVLPKGAPIS